MKSTLMRLLAVALPTIRDFRGVSNKLDGQGNYTIGITDFTIFPEIVVESNKRQMGLDITFVTSAESDDEAREFLKLMGMPFRRTEPVNTGMQRIRPKGMSEDCYRGQSPPVPLPFQPCTSNCINNVGCAMKTPGYRAEK